MDLDVTLIFQLFLLVAVLLSLNVLLFKPFLAVIEGRHQKIHGTKSTVEQMERQSDADLDAYTARLTDARRQAQAEREHMRQAARDAERKLLAEVRADIARSLNGTREQVATEESVAQKSLAGQTDALARQLVGKVLGREVAV